MKRYIKSSKYLQKFPQTIQIELYPEDYVLYEKMYEHEGGGCYYRTKDLVGADNILFGSFVSLYPDGSLTYLWNGIEKPLDRNWK